MILKDGCHLLVNRRRTLRLAAIEPHLGATLREECRHARRILGIPRGQQLRVRRNYFLILTGHAIPPWSGLSIEAAAMPMLGCHVDGNLRHDFSATPGWEPGADMVHCPSSILRFPCQRHTSRPCKRPTRPSRGATTTHSSNTAPRTRNGTSSATER